MKLGQVRKLATVLLLGAFLFGLLGGFVFQNNVLINITCAAALACIAGYWGVLIKFWRCPECGAHLPTRAHFCSVKHCPQCGKELDTSRW